MNINMAGQTINDRILAARHSLAGQGLAKSVCKATTEEMIGPKKKHLDCKCLRPQENFPSSSPGLLWVLCDPTPSPSPRREADGSVVVAKSGGLGRFSSEKERKLEDLEKSIIQWGTSSSTSHP